MRNLKLWAIFACCLALTACGTDNKENSNNIEKESSTSTEITDATTITEETTIDENSSTSNEEEINSTVTESIEESESSKSDHGLSPDEYTEEYINFVETAEFPVNIPIENDFETLLSTLDSSNYTEFPVKSQNGLEDGALSVYFIFTDPQYMYYNIENADPYEIGHDYAIVVCNHSDKPVILSHTPYNSQSKTLEAVLAPHAVESMTAYIKDIDDEYIENIKNTVLYAYELTQENYETDIINNESYYGGPLPEDVNDYINILSHKDDMKYEFNITDRYNGTLNISNLTGWIDAINNYLPEDSYNKYMNYNILLFSDSKLVDRGSSNFDIYNLTIEENEPTTTEIEENKKHYSDSYQQDDFSIGWGKATRAIVLPRYGLSTAP